MTIAVRRERIDAEFRRAALDDLPLLEIKTDAYTDAHAWAEALTLTNRFGLSVYDAVNLELACRRTLLLATLDTELSAAVTALGLHLLGSGA